MDIDEYKAEVSEFRADRIAALEAEVARLKGEKDAVEQSNANIARENTDLELENARLREALEAIKRLHENRFDAQFLEGVATYRIATQALAAGDAGKE